MSAFKHVVFVLIVIVGHSSYCQEPFKKDGKWGISEFGSADDSIIVPAKYDDVKIIFPEEFDPVYIGEENDEWKIISQNRMISQQSYTEIVLPEFLDQFIYCYRDQYIDIIDLKKVDFLIRTVKAEKIVNPEGALGDLKNVLMVVSEDKYGLVDVNNGKKILKTEYEWVRGNQKYSDEVPIIAYKDEVNYVFKRNGEEIFKIESDLPLTSVEAYENCPSCYTLYSNDKKGGYGFYDVKNNWLVPTVFNSIVPISDAPEIVITQGKKGMGIYFEGKELLEAEYDQVSKSDKRGYLAVVKKKDETFYLTPQGKLVVLD